MRRALAPSRIRRLSLLALPLVLVAALSPLSSHAAPPSADVGMDLTIVDPAKVWETATKDAPLADKLLVDYLDGALGVVAPAPQGGSDDGGFGGGIVLEPSDPVGSSGAPGTAASGRVVLPIVLVGAADARLVHRRRALLEQYLAAHASLVRAARRVSEVNASATIALSSARATAAHVELFALESIAHVSGETQPQKCGAYWRASAHASALGFTFGTSDTPVVPPGWEGLLTHAKRLYDTHFATFPAVLCAQSRPATLTETRAKLGLKIEAQIQRAVVTELDAAKRALEGVEGKFATAFTQSKVPVDVKAIYELQRAVEDAKAGYDWVRSDSQLLLGPNGGLLGALEAKAANVTSLKDSGSLRPAVVVDAEAALADARKTAADLLAIAKNLADVGGLSAAQREQLATCTALPTAVEALGPGTATGAAKALDTCLSSTVALCKTLQASGPVGPERATLTKKVLDLSSVYLTVNESVRSRGPRRRT